MARMGAWDGGTHSPFTPIQWNPPQNHMVRMITRMHTSTSLTGGRDGRGEREQKKSEEEMLLQTQVSENEDEKIKVWVQFPHRLQQRSPTLDHQEFYFLS